MSFILNNKKCFFCKKDFLHIPLRPFDDDLQKSKLICNSHNLKLTLMCSTIKSNTSTPNILVQDISLTEKNKTTYLSYVWGEPDFETMSVLRIEYNKPSTIIKKLNLGLLNYTNLTFDHLYDSIKVLLLFS